MNFQDTRIREVSQTHKRTNTVCIYLYEAHRVVKFIDISMVFTRAWEWGNRKLGFHGYRVSVWGDDQVLKMDTGDGCKALLKSFTTMNCALKMVNFMLHVFCHKTNSHQS